MQGKHSSGSWKIRASPRARAPSVAAHSMGLFVFFRTSSQPKFPFSNLVLNFFPILCCTERLPGFTKAGRICILTEHGSGEESHSACDRGRHDSGSTGRGSTQNLVPSTLTTWVGKTGVSWSIRSDSHKALQGLVESWSRVYWKQKRREEIPGKGFSGTMCGKQKRGERLVGLMMQTTKSPGK